MSMSKADVILHPVRMKIIQSLIKRPLTVQELMEWLPEIPQATLYRQLKVLTENEIIFITEERKIRGAYERTYSLNDEKANLSSKDVSELSKEEHLKFFMTYTANLIQGVEQYLDSDGLDMEKDGFSYRQVDLYLNNEEFANFKKDISEVFKKYLNHEPTKERRRRTVATILIPDTK